jgi:hypothetical protein
VRSQFFLYLNEVVRILTGHPVYVIIGNVVFLQNHDILQKIEFNSDAVTNVGGKLSNVTKLPFSTSNACMLVISSDELVIIGGMNERLIFDVVLLYSISNNTWAYGPKLSQERSNHMCAIINNVNGTANIFVTGGFARNVMLESTEILTTGSNEWTLGIKKYIGIRFSLLQRRKFPIT